MTSLYTLLNQVERLDVSGSVIVQPTNAQTDANTVGGTDADVSGVAVALATGYPYTNGGQAGAPNSPNNIDVVSLQLLGERVFTLIDFVQFRGLSESSWRYLSFSLIRGGKPNTSGGSLVTPAIQAISRPFDRDGVLRLGLLVVTGDGLLRLTVTNSDDQAPHMAEGRIAAYQVKSIGTDCELADLIRYLGGKS